MTQPSANPGELSRLYELVQSGDASALAALAPNTAGLSRNPITRFFDGRRAAALTKSVGSAFMKAAQRDMEAAKQGTVVSQGMELMGVYGGVRGVLETTGMTFQILRDIMDQCEPAAAIRKRRVDQVAAYAQVAQKEAGQVVKAGFHLRLASKSEEPSKAQIKEMENLEGFFEEAGFCEPPEEEKPNGWQPGLEPFFRQVVDDSITLDHVAVRRWGSGRNKGKFPLVSFAAVDAGKVRYVRPWIEKIVNGVPIREAWDTQRTNARGDKIKTVMMDSLVGGMISQEFTGDELFCGVRNPRTDERANGYGQSEGELAFTAMTGWIYGREYNMLRFRKDNLPRGMLLLQGKINTQQADAFRLHWKEMFSGLGSRWGIPVLSSQDEKGGVVWTPFDLSSRDMEYHQMMFSWALWLHSLYGIHPEETGFEALSPFRPPLSEASPETKLKYSQDSGLDPLLRWLAALMNREILWKMIPDRRYRFEFLGMGDTDEMAGAEAAQARLSAGISTPRKELAARDCVLEDWVKECPALDLPMPFPEGLQMLMQMQQAKQAQEQQAQAAQQQQDQGKQAMAAQQYQMAQAGQGPDGQPMGAGGPPGAAPGQAGGFPNGKEADPMAQMGQGEMTGGGPPGGEAEPPQLAKSVMLTGRLTEDWPRYL